MPIVDTSSLRVIERSPASVNSDVAAFRPPEFLEPLPECGQVSRKFRVALGMRHQHADPSHLHGLLRASSERPRDSCSAERGNEFPPCDVDRHRTLHWGSCALDHCE